MKLKNLISLIYKINLPKDLLNIIIDYSGLIKNYFGSVILSQIISYKKDTLGGFNFNSLEEFHYIRNLNTYFINNFVTDKFNTVVIEKNYYKHDNSINYIISFEESWDYVYNLKKAYPRYVSPFTIRLNSS